LTINSFRAGFATLLYRTTGDIWLVARALEHNSVATTRRYIETDSEDIRKALERAFSPLSQ
jgi:site-specific recombinase XerD